jgi:hypothetical protein
MNNGPRKGFKTRNGRNIWFGKETACNDEIVEVGAFVFPLL